MPFESVIAELKTRHDAVAAKQVRLSSADVERWVAISDLTPPELLDQTAIYLARGFHRGELHFTFCDAVVNQLFAWVTNGRGSWQPLFRTVYEAFDAGEYYHKEDSRDIDPVEKYTRPLIATIVEQYGSSLSL
jgi:hypothetical protein